MKIYSVGGSVRDELLGLPVKDRDYVVVGTTPEAMERLGYRPVGKDFPVFLHPQTQEEYALARTERKVARGYKGFAVRAAPDVTLEQDLERRDLTINALARDDDGALIDPFGGERDLRMGLLRHVGPAFVEDPVRLLRVARFAARFDFDIAPETMALMRRMVTEGEADALVPERVWQEFATGLMEAHPSRLFQVLHASGLLQRLLPELDLTFGAAEDRAPPANAAARRLFGGLAHAAAHAMTLEVRFSLLGFALRAPGEALAEALCAHLRTPVDCRDALLLVVRRGAEVRAQDATRDAAAVLDLLEAADAFRRPERLQTLLAACECADAGDGLLVAEPYAPRERLQGAAAAAKAVDAGAVARACGAAGSDIGAAVRAARREAIAAALGLPSGNRP